jgi:CheY-like chemotaxis protein
MEPAKGPHRILLIEDNGDFVYLFSSLLTHMGHECMPALSGAEGIRKAKEMKPDIIFCDIGLPDMDGFDVSKKIREEPGLKDVYIAAVTGYSDRGRNRDADSAFNAYLIKPVSMSDIKRLLERIDSSG